MWQTCQMGFFSGMNPFMLATVLIFCGLLSIYTHTRAQLIMAGVIYIASVWAVNFLVLNGNYDHLIYQPHVEQLVSMTYSILAVVFLYAGFVHFNDWMLLRRGKDALMLGARSPRGIDFGPRTGQWFRYIYLAFIFLFIAWHISIFEASLTQNYYLFVTMFQYIKSDASLTRAIASFVAYMIAYTLFLWLFWALCLLDSASMRVRSLLNKYLGMEKLVFAALYWGASVGLLFYLLNIRKLVQ